MSSPAARARALAAQAIERVVGGRSLDDTLDGLFGSLPPALENERALIQELVYGGIRWHVRLTALTSALLAKPLADKDADLAALLRLGLYQLLSMRVAPHAAVNESVNAAALLGKGWAKGLINAVLRRALRERDALRARIATDERLELATPDWLLARLQAAWPDDWRAIAAAGNARPPLTLRVHAGRSTPAASAAKLAGAGFATRTIAELEHALMLVTPVPVEQLPGFAVGEFTVQDAAAQLAAPLLEVAPGQRVLDACAAPGGKATHILELTPAAQLVALDIDGSRLARLRANFARLGLTGEIVTGDAAAPTGWWDGRPFDRILLDAPCSATGVIRRHPDIRLHRTPRDIERLVASQARLLDALWPLLAPGGKLVYVTCSILPEENRDTITAFLDRRRDARTQSLVHPALARYAHFDGIGYQLLPGTADMDGFYYAALTPSGTAN